MAPADAPITFVVTGQPLADAAAGGGGLRGSGAAPAMALPGRLKASVRVGARRAGGTALRLQAVPGEDLVVLHIANGPSLVLHPLTARALLLGQDGTARGGGAADEVPVATQLRWPALEQAAPTRTRGFLGEVLLAAVEVFTGAAGLSAGALAARIDGAVQPGLYPLRAEALAPLAGGGAQVAPAGEQPILVFLHGTFVDTAGTFGKLWVLHPDRVRALFTRYGGRVHALDHPTLGASPVANALALVRQLPAGVRLHLVTHSRGGLVAEVLARIAARSQLTPQDLACFAGDAYAAQRDELQQLAALVRRLGIRVERVVRVACPARGTLLASRRLDAWLSALKWSLDLAGVPVAAALVDFLAAVAMQRTDPLQLPGLAAMVPDSPLVQWLNRPDGAIAGELRVVAGDLEGDSVGSWVKTLLADAFYWTDNDLVVQTRSMYGGAPRAGGARFLLDQGGRVTHFNYFGNPRTADAVVDALVEDEPAGFRPIGPLSWAGEESGGVRGALRAPPPADAAARPAVIVLPGLFGSQLAADGVRLWLGPRLVGALPRLAWTGAEDGVAPDGPIEAVYGGLLEHLAATHEVMAFAFDWRRPIEDEAQRLADAVGRALDARAGSGQPVQLLACSSGGLVARTLQLERPAVWQRLMAHPQARLVMLGTPNDGCWTPMQLLSGDDSFDDALAAFGAPGQEWSSRQQLAEMPGLLQLQAGLGGALELDREAEWQRLADEDLQRVAQRDRWHRGAPADGSGSGSGADALRWGVPPQAVLDRAAALRRRLDRQRDEALPGFADKLRLVVGQAERTPDGFAVTEAGLVYLDVVDGGDGRVPHALSLLPGVRTWWLGQPHGALPECRAAFAALTELLLQGETARLRPYDPPAARRGGPPPAPAHVHSRPSRGDGAALPPTDAVRAVLSAAVRPRAGAGAAAGTALQVTVLNGNLSFLRQPLLLGHYRSSALTGTEAVVDRLVGRAMTAALQAGLYPEAPGTQQVFVNTRRDPENPWQAPRPQAAIVVGLGEEGTLTVPALVHSVRQGVVAWAQRLAETGGAPATFELAATLAGSGGVGISPGASAAAVAQGVFEANARLAAAGWPVAVKLTLVELYLERASEAWHGLGVMATASPGRLDVAPLIASGTGPLRRPLQNGYRGADYDLITASSPSPDTIAFTLDTQRARSEVRAVTTQGRLVRELVLRGSHDANDDPQIGRTLFQLLVPQDMEPFLGGTTRMLLELDLPSAGIPWELLDLPEDQRAGGDRRPWALRSQLLRRLRTDTFQTSLRDAAADDSVLVIGEPLTGAAHAPLPAARAEAQAVAAALRGPGGVAPERVLELADGEDATTVVNALMSRPWRIVHIAGHGEPGADGGVVLSDGLFLGAREIERLRTVPELVFVNCCYLAARELRTVLAAPPHRGEFAAGMADALIQLGVRCVVAAGWAVEDEPARLFASTLYQALLSGQRFIDAVAGAREACWAEGGNTWAAYQCYGDPDWHFRSDTGDAQAPAGDPLQEFASIASPLGLAFALETLATRSRFQGAQDAAQLERIRHLQARFGEVWGGIGAVAEAFGVACAAARAMPEAVDWYTRAAACNDASASMRAGEQLGNLRARLAWERVEAAGPAAEPALLAGARQQIEDALKWLAGLTAWQPTIERLTLCGSACKRLALVARRAGDGAAAAKAVSRMADYYTAAERLALESGHPEAFHPALNRMAAALVVHAGDHDWPGPPADEVAVVHAGLQSRAEADPDFWSWIGLVELELYTALAGRRLAASQADLARAYVDLHDRVSAAWMWASVADQADFVLPPWLAQAPPQEQRAGAALQEQIAGYARR